VISRKKLSTKLYKWEKVGKLLLDLHLKLESIVRIYWRILL